MGGSGDDGIDEIGGLNSSGSLPRKNMVDNSSVVMWSKLGQTAHFDIFLIRRSFLDDSSNSSLAKISFGCNLPSRYTRGAKNKDSIPLSRWNRLDGNYERFYDFYK